MEVDNLVQPDRVKEGTEMNASMPFAGLMLIASILSLVLVVVEKDVRGVFVAVPCIFLLLLAIRGERKDNKSARLRVGEPFFLFSKEDGKALGIATFERYRLAADLAEIPEVDGVLLERVEQFRLLNNRIIFGHEVDWLAVPPEGLQSLLNKQPEQV